MFAQVLYFLGYRRQKRSTCTFKYIYYLIANRDSTFTFTTPLQNCYNRMQFKIIWLHVHLKNIFFINTFILLLNVYLNVECDKS